MTIATQRTQIAAYLRAFDFRRLFIEELGWDRYQASLTVEIKGGATFALQGVAEKRGVVALLCEPDARGGIPDYATRKLIEDQVVKSVREHLIVFTDAEHNQQFWLWTKRTQGQRPQYRGEWFYKGQSGERLVQKLQEIVIPLASEEDLTLLDVTTKLEKGFDVERVTKKFYDRFQKEHEVFVQAITGIDDDDLRRWYASLMLNRLMFTYFIQKKGFLDGHLGYLRNRLEQVRALGRDKFHSFYRGFLLRLFHDGLGKPAADRRLDPELAGLIGNVPYLNGGLFEVHQIESGNRDIAIPDSAFERIFAFFDEYDWYLDDRPLRNDREINPDVLGYIFEKYINQKQMGAYYSKEDITGYIGRNTILPFLFDQAREKCRVAFEPGGEVWRLLQDDPDRYIYEAVRKGVDEPLPPEIEAGVNDVSKRGGWNRPAPEPYALPTETWREHVARRTRCLELRSKLVNGEVTQVNDLITYNLDVERLARDAIERCEGPEVVRAFWQAITSVTVLDPACGSGAFLFAALNILEPLYGACLDRMQAFVVDFDRLGERPKGRDFREILARIAQHPNRRYYILKSIIIGNLYGVDIMAEACEIAKLRLFLALVAQVDEAEKLEPLPDIDFNIRAGNTLVGFASYADAERVITSKLDFDNAMERIREKAGDLSSLFERFREQQTMHGGRVEPADKAELRRRLGELGDELDRYLAAEYGIDGHHYPNKREYDAKLAAWQESHKPFHWFVEFYSIVQGRGGFDVIIGNPPYVEYSSIRSAYRIQESRFATLSSGNLYAFFWERALVLARDRAMCSFIVPISSASTPRMEQFVSLTRRKTMMLWVSQYAVRPSKLFVGVDMNLTILVSQVSSVNAQERGRREWTTTYQRWSPISRGYLFANLSYVSTSNAPSLFEFAIPKLRARLEDDLLKKVSAQKRLSALLSPERRVTRQQLSYRTAGGRYYKVFLDRPLDSESKSNKTTSLRESADVRVVLAALSSGLWWWYYTLHFDMYNCKDYMMFGFPFIYPSGSRIETELRTLGAALVDDLYKNAGNCSGGR